MTGRRRWSRFSIRSGLILISTIAILLATHSHFQAKGQRRQLAMRALSQLGVTAVPLGDTVDYDDFTFTGTTRSDQSSAQSSVRLVLPKVAKAKPSKLSGLGRRVLGSAIFDDYGTLLVYKPISNDGDFLNQLDDLPNVNSVHYYQNTVDDSLVDQIKQKHPRISLRPLDADAPKDTSGNSVLVLR